MCKSCLMQPEYENIAIEVIELHKVAPGNLFNWHPYYVKHSEDDNHLINALSVKKLLIDKGLLAYWAADKEYITRLTEKGIQWEGFEKERQQLEEKAKQEKIGVWPKKHWIVFPFITGLIGLGFGITSKAIEKYLWPDRKAPVVDSTKALVIDSTKAPVVDSTLKTIINNKSKSYLYESITPNRATRKE